MEILHLEGFPPPLNKGGLYRLLLETGKIKKSDVGRIVMYGRTATVEVSDGCAARLVRALDGLQVETRHIRAWQQTPANADDGRFRQLLRWLDLEAAAERDEQARRAAGGSAAGRGDAFTRLVIRGEDVGLGGRFLVQLAPRNQQADLPWTRLTIGSPVLLQAEDSGDGQQAWRGVISRLHRRRVEVAFSRLPEPENEDGTFRLQLSSDEIVRRRMQQALSRTAAAKGSRLAELRAILLGEQPPQFAPPESTPETDAALAALNPSQRQAVQHALAAEDVAVIHGPPGTGKTTTVTALIIAAISRGEKVLACAPSNLAVDNLVERLAAAGARLVRIGHPIRVLPEVQAFTLDALVAEHEDYRLAKQYRREARGLQAQAAKFRRARPEKGARQAQRQEARSLLDEARRLEAQAVAQVLDQARVILATLTGIDSTLMGQRAFDLCVIDEAGQSTEPATWIPIVRARKLVLAGDHQQLPPTIISQQAAQEGFGVSLLERLMQQHGAQIGRRLAVQYRMHADIMGFSAAEFYENGLTADTAVAHHRLTDLPGVTATPLTDEPVTFIDTAGASFDEVKDAESASTGNPQEANLVAKLVQRLRDAGVSLDQIAVITPYSAQVQLLRERLPDGVEIGSVDGFQGREKEAVIISLVRSNSSGSVGFLAETRRMNVALTRARRKLIVVGDSATITAHPFYVRLVEYFEQIGAYHSVWEGYL